MALKDWKKINNNVFVLRNNTEEIIVIQKFLEGWFVRRGIWISNKEKLNKRITKDDIILNFFSVIPPLNKRPFKTKFQALKYAKEYMKKH